jgi:hypothetical protein
MFFMWASVLNIIQKKNLVSEELTVHFSRFRIFSRKFIQLKYGFKSSKFGQYNKDNVYAQFRNTFRAAEVPVHLPL